MIKETDPVRSGYVSYEYRQISVPAEHVSLCLDSYPCFGWEPDPNHGEPLDGRRAAPSFAAGRPGAEVELFFRRSRSICSKAELTRLQRNFDSCIAELAALKKAKTSHAAVAALSVGLLGTAFMAGSTFSVVADPPIIWLTVLLAIPGFLGWALPVFVYRALVRKRTAEIEPLIEQKYDEISGLCEKGSSLQH